MCIQQLYRFVFSKCIESSSKRGSRINSKCCERREVEIKTARQSDEAPDSEKAKD